MEMFYTIVVLIAVIVLILFLTFMGILLRNQGANEIFPPQGNNCPDYWSTNASGNCLKPSVKSFSSSDPNSTLNIGVINTALSSNSAPYSTDGVSFNKSDPLWSANGKSAICAQKTWSVNNGIIWDGVSNYNQC